MKASPVEPLEHEEEIFPDPFLEERITKLTDEIARLDGNIAILTGTHPLFAVYRVGKGWRAEYRGKGGRMRATGCQTAQEGLSWVEWMKERVTE